MRRNETRSGMSRKLTLKKRRPRYLDSATAIKKLREGLDMTQSDLAKELGLTKQTISNWECRHSIPTKPQFIKLKSSFKKMWPRSVKNELSDLEFYRRNLISIYANQKGELLKEKRWKKETQQKLELALRKYERSNDIVFLRAGDLTNKSPESIIRKNYKIILPSVESPDEKIKRFNSFAFKIENNDMCPKIDQGKTDICSLKVGPVSGDVVLVKCRDQKPICRLLEVDGSEYRFKASNTQPKIITKHKWDINWCYPVLAVIQRDAKI